MLEHHLASIACCIPTTLLPWSQAAPLESEARAPWRNKMVASNSSNARLVHGVAVPPATPRAAAAGLGSEGHCLHVAARSLPQLVFFTSAGRFYFRKTYGYALFAVQLFNWMYLLICRYGYLNNLYLGRGRNHRFDAARRRAGTIVSAFAVVMRARWPAALAVGCRGFLRAAGHVTCSRQSWPGYLCQDHLGLTRCGFAPKSITCVCSRGWRRFRCGLQVNACSAPGYDSLLYICCATHIAVS